MTRRTYAVAPMIKREWERHGVGLRAGATAVEIEGFERKHGIELPQDLADYFRAVDGMGEDEADQLGIRFWSLHELRRVVAELPTPEAGRFQEYFVFADYSMWAHGYAVRLGQPEDDVIIVGGDQAIAVAASFGEFLQLYLTEPDRLFPDNARTR